MVGLGCEEEKRGDRDASGCVLGFLLDDGGFRREWRRGIRKWWV